MATAEGVEKATPAPPGGAALFDCQPANTARQYQVAPDQLPVSCPPAQGCLWNAHPRVYLAFDDKGRARCPYCSAEYCLVPGPGAPAAS